MDPDGAWGQTAKKTSLSMARLSPTGFLMVQPWGDHENGMLMVNDLNICLVVEPPTPLKNDGVGQMG